MSFHADFMCMVLFSLNTDVFEALQAFRRESDRMAKRTGVDVTELHIVFGEYDVVAKVAAEADRGRPGSTRVAEWVNAMRELPRGKDHKYVRSSKTLVIVADPEHAHGSVGPE